ncbi:LysR substrate-binding domain-containing protein [Massilia sp. DWR3-1-1]|uniref:LysR substrate-binding domain-containing protein n=1 Tax=Massilia sp. DWR3-1-1 TaxID=2804559 RepID=UPI003CEBA45B
MPVIANAHVAYAHVAYAHVAYAHVAYAHVAIRFLPSAEIDSKAHNWVSLRLSTHGGLYAWEFEKDGHALDVRVQGQLTFNSSRPMLRAALAGFGIAFVPEDLVEAHVAAGRLQRVLADWTATFPGYHLYYASRRQSSPALGLLIEALRYRPGPAGPG